MAGVGREEDKARGDACGVNECFRDQLITRRKPRRGVRRGNLPGALSQNGKATKRRQSLCCVAQDCHDEMKDISGRVPLRVRWVASNWRGRAHRRVEMQVEERGKRCHAVQASRYEGSTECSVFCRRTLFVVIRNGVTPRVQRWESRGRYVASYSAIRVAARETKSVHQAHGINTVGANVGRCPRYCLILTPGRHSAYAYSSAYAFRPQAARQFASRPPSMS